MNDVPDSTHGEHSFVKELLNYVIQYIRENYPHIQKFKLNDKSYIPCDNDDTTDLLTYSIALYGKTWYELYYNAYIQNSNIFKQYRAQIQTMNSPEFKKKYTWEIFCLEFLPPSTNFTKNLFEKNDGLYRDFFESSQTFPEFFRKLNRTIDKKDKCLFYKFWLEQFVSKHVIIHREWYFDADWKKGGRRMHRTSKMTKRRLL